MVKPTIGVLAAAGMLVSGIVPLSSYASALRAPSWSPKRVKAQAVAATPEQAWRKYGREGIEGVYRICTMGCLNLDLWSNSLDARPFKGSTVPLPEVGRRLVRGLNKGEEDVVRMLGRADHIVRE